MSRSGYCDEMEDNWAMICWRGAVNSAVKGKRGQAFLSDMAKALDAMLVKELIANELISAEGNVCALGAVAKQRCLKIDGLDPENSEEVAETFGIAEALAKEIVWENDEGRYGETPKQRWQRIRKWVAANLLPSVEGRGSVKP